MLIPKDVHGQMVMVDNAPFDLQERLQKGCDDCGWQGDPFLNIYVVPRKYGDGYAVIHKQPGEKALILWLSEPPMHALDHRLIDFFNEARKNWELGAKIAQVMEDHDSKVDAQVRRQEAEMNVEVSKMVGQFMRKHDMTPTKHKIDKKKD